MPRRRKQPHRPSHARSTVCVLCTLPRLHDMWRAHASRRASRPKENNERRVLVCEPRDEKLQSKFPPYWYGTKTHFSGTNAKEQYWNGKSTPACLPRTTTKPPQPPVQRYSYELVWARRALIHTSRGACGRSVTHDDKLARRKEAPSFTHSRKHRWGQQQPPLPPSNLHKHPRQYRAITYPAAQGGNQSQRLLPSAVQCSNQPLYLWTSIKKVYCCCAIVAVVCRRPLLLYRKGRQSRRL